jgi:two-component system LytT family response regulator
MPGKDGFCFLEEIPPGLKDTEIVFVTAFDQYALKAIKKKAFDYLLKPVDRSELRECIIKLQDNLDKKNTPINLLDLNTPISKYYKIKINTRNGLLFINPESILYIKADSNYSDIYTDEKMISCSFTLGKVAELLPETDFVRIGRSFIFNSRYLYQLDRKKSEITLRKDEKFYKVLIPKNHMKDLDNI